MSKLKRLSGDEVIRRLEKLGYQRMSQSGSHVVLKKQKSEGEIERLDAMPFELENFQDHAKLGYLLLLIFELLSNEALLL